MKKGVLIEKVRELIRADNKNPPGRDATADMIGGLPSEIVKATPTTKDGVFIGSAEDLKWWFGK